jgi:outer membrane protein TolC
MHLRTHHLIKMNDLKHFLLLALVLCVFPSVLGKERINKAANKTQKIELKTTTLSPSKEGQSDIKLNSLDKLLSESQQISESKSKLFLDLDSNTNLDIQSPPKTETESKSEKTTAVLADESESSSGEETEIQTIKGSSEAIELNLETVIDLTEKHNLDFALAKNQTKQAKFTFFGSFAPLFPSITSQSSVERFEGGEIFIGATPVNNNRTTYRPTLSGDYQIQTGGKDIFRAISYKKHLNGVKYEQNRIYQESLLKGCSKYFIWLKDIESIRLAQQAVIEAENQVKLKQSRFEAGFSTKLELLQAQSVLSENQNLLLKAENERELSKVNLSADLDLPLISEVNSSDKLHEINLIDKKITLAELLTFDKKNRPDLKELKALIEEARAKYKESIAELFPTISLSTYIRGIGQSPSDLDRSKQGQVSLNMNLLRNMGTGALSNIAVSREMIKEAILRKEKQMNEAEKQLASAYYDFNLYRQQLSVTKQRIETNQEAYKMALSRINNGVGINLDAVKAQTDLVKSQIEYVTAVMNYNNSQLKLLYETGQLSPQKVLANYPETEISKIQ